MEKIKIQIDKVSGVLVVDKIRAMDYFSEGNAKDIRIRMGRKKSNIDGVQISDNFNCWTKS